MSVRTFIAIDLPTALYGPFRDIQRALAAQLDAQLPTSATPDRAGLRWTQPELTHLTLRFIGDTPEEKLPTLAQALHVALAAESPLALQLRGLGCFPNWRKPRVIWLGMDGEVDGLHTLQKKVEEVVQATGFAPEAKPYRPHLTLARTIRAARSAHLARLGAVLSNLHAADPQFSQPVGAPFSVTEVVHFQSDLPGRGRGSPVYTPLTRVHLGGA